MFLFRILFFSFLILFCRYHESPGAETIRTPVTTAVTAIDAYENGCVSNVMRSPDKHGVILEDWDLIENDSPGAGTSEKGCWLEEIHRGVLARKILRLHDPSAFDAHLVLYLIPKNTDRDKQASFYVIFNGTKIRSNTVPSHEEGHWRWIQIPVKLLRQGGNTVILGCEAPKGEGYDLLIARADEYEKGGGFLSPDGKKDLFNAEELRIIHEETPDRPLLEAIGGTSAKSPDGGRTWIQKKLGTANNVTGEYSIRLNLNHYKRKGSLDSPCIDLWEGAPGYDVIKPYCAVSSLSLAFEGDAPQGTKITWQIRSSDSPDIMGNAWGDFVTVGIGGNITVHPENLSKRYIQWRATLETGDRMKTPTIRKVSVQRTLTFTAPKHHIYVMKSENVRHRYSSYDFTYETWDDPKLKLLRSRLGLDSLLADSNGDWEKINRLRHYVSAQWKHKPPFPSYPEWDALEILDRRDKTGYGGMCVQFAQVCIQALLSLGYQAHFVTEFDHEVVEVYVDELGKWALVDPESVFDSYEYDTATGLPLNALEQHRWFLFENGFSAEKPIDWTTPLPWPIQAASEPVKAHAPLDFSTFTGWINDPSKPDYPPLHRLAGSIGISLRNNWFSQPYPRPVSEGMTYWPWNGFLNWYDEATPRMYQYSLHSDRESDFHPTLNRVEYYLTQTEREDQLAVYMTTFTPNFARFEINCNGTGWRESPSDFIWKLRPSALNTLSMRVRNKLDHAGKSSSVEILYHYKAPNTGAQ